MFIYFLLAPIGAEPRRGPVCVCPRREAPHLLCNKYRFSLNLTIFPHNINAWILWVCVRHLTLYHIIRAPVRPNYSKLGGAGPRVLAVTLVSCDVGFVLVNRHSPDIGAVSTAQNSNISVSACQSVCLSVSFLCPCNHWLSVSDHAYVAIRKMKIFLFLFQGTVHE